MALLDMTPAYNGSPALALFLVSYVFVVFLLAAILGLG